MSIRSYTTLFSCIHDEPSQYGNLGRGTHYSIFRMVPPLQGKVKDFAVIWDEDHDERVIHAIEEMVMRQLMAGVLFVGERKGMLTVLIADGSLASADISGYRALVQEAVNNASIDDYWNVEVDVYRRGEYISSGIINDGSERVTTYLENIDNLWQLGMKKPPKKPSSVPDLFVANELTL